MSRWVFGATSTHFQNPHAEIFRAAFLGLDVESRGQFLIIVYTQTMAVITEGFFDKSLTLALVEAWNAATQENLTDVGTRPPTFLQKHPKVLYTLSTQERQWCPRCVVGKSSDEQRRQTRDRRSTSTLRSKREDDRSLTDRNDPHTSRLRRRPFSS